MKDFLKDLFSGNSSVSSKRVNGTLGWALACLLTLLVVVVDIDIKPAQEGLINSLFLASSALVAGGTVTEIFKNKQK